MDYELMKAKGAQKKGGSSSAAEGNNRLVLNNMTHAKEVLENHYKKQLFGVDYDGMTKEEQDKHILGFSNN